MLRMVFGKPFLHPLAHDGMRAASEQVINLWTIFAKTGSIPDVNGLIFGRYTFHISRERKKDDVFDGLKQYWSFLNNSMCTDASCEWSS
ncbi:hypothetical protein MRX96_030681 [Rhipicephalus microplus]